MHRKTTAIKKLKFCPTTPTLTPPGCLAHGKGVFDVFKYIKYSCEIAWRLQESLFAVLMNNLCLLDYVWTRISLWTYRSNFRSWVCCILSLFLWIIMSDVALSLNSVITIWSWKQTRNWRHMLFQFELRDGRSFQPTMNFYRMFNKYVLHSIRTESQSN